MAKTSSMLKWMSFLFLALTSTVSLLQCPHSKVEESFNLQATHDLYYYGIGPALHATLGYSNKDDESLLVYDHLQYPGVVPRTFCGPFLISTILKLITLAVKPFANLKQMPLFLQSLARGILLIFNLHAHLRLANAAERKFCSGNQFLLGGYFLLITASQFHLPFYASRMLPNSFALGLVTHTYADWLQSNITRAIVLLTFGTAIFRCDMLILLFTFGITILIRKEIGIFKAVKIGLFSAITALLVTIPLDSIMWQKVIWPEGEVLFFNTVANKSSDYGISPWHWYILKALPKGLLLPILLVPFSFTRVSQIIAGFKVHLWDLAAFPYFMPVLAFIGLYSILPHKEIRFIFAAFPMFNVLAAKTLATCHKTASVTCSSTKQEPKSSPSKVIIRLIHGGCLAAVSLSLVASVIFVQVSTANYPGGEGLLALSKHLAQFPKSDEPIQIYIDVASAMTGVSLFGQRSLIQKCPAPQCNIQKGGYELNNDYDDMLSNGKFDFILCSKSTVKGYKVVDIAKGHPIINWRDLSIHTRNAIFVLEKERDHN